MFVLKSTFNRALRDIASLKNLVDSYEALLFQSDPNWKRRFRMATNAGQDSKSRRH